MYLCYGFCMCVWTHMCYLLNCVNMTAYCQNTDQEWNYVCLGQNCRKGRQESCDLSFSRTWTCSWNACVFLLLPGTAEKRELTLDHPRQPDNVLCLPLWKNSHKVRGAMERHSQDSAFHKWKGHSVKVCGRLRWEPKGQPWHSSING